MPAYSQYRRITVLALWRLSAGEWRALYDTLREKMRKTLGLIQHEDRSDVPAVAAIERLRRLASPDWRSQLLRSAATQFAVTGLRGTTTSMLARAAGVSERFLDAHFGSNESLFREAVEDNIQTRLQLLEAHAVPALFASETAVIERIAEATVTVCVEGPGNSILTNWALLEDPDYAADLYRDEIGSVEIVWNRQFTERFPDSRSRRILSIHLVPYAVSACLAYGFWLATLRHDAGSAAALAKGFAAGIAQAAATLLSQQS